MSKLNAPAIVGPVPPLKTDDWHEFRYDEIFDIRKGYYNKKPPEAQSGVPFIGATESNNGVTSYVSLEDLKKFSKDGSINLKEPIERKVFPGKCITVSNNGSVGEAFYQPIEFTCTHDVNPLYLLDKSVELTPEIAMFLCAVIRLDKYRWGYGRKWRPKRMPSSTISLPAVDGTNAKGKKCKKPDWAAMTDYIKHLAFSSSLE